MSAGSGGAQTLVQVETMREADYRTALEIARATAKAWEDIARARMLTIHALSHALERYQRRSPN